MTGKFLGKITAATFGLDDLEIRLALHLSLSFDGAATDLTITDMAEVLRLLKDAKINNVVALRGKPIEISIDRNVVTHWRILTEVL